MNNTRRKAIRKVIEELETLSSRIDDLRDEEQDYLDNIPENLQTSERYSDAETAVDNLDSAVNAVDEAISLLEEAL